MTACSLGDTLSSLAHPSTLSTTIQAPALPNSVCLMFYAEGADRATQRHSPLHYHSTFGVSLTEHSIFPSGGQDEGRKRTMEILQ